MYCKKFAGAVDSDVDVQKALESVVLYRIDCEKGEGKDIAKEYAVRGYPTFILMNKDGKVIDRWAGYSKEYLLRTLSDAMLDLSTIEEKLAQMKIKPELHTAVSLGRYSSSMDNFKDAVDYYKTAQTLKTDPNADYNSDIFENTLEGTAKGSFSNDELKAAADNAIAAMHDPADIFGISANMVSYAKQHELNQTIVEYLQTGLDATANNNDKKIDAMHRTLMVDYCLLVKHDTASAVEYKKGIMPEGWMENADQLNEFAWWCFENNADLKEAETLAHKAVDMAQPGKGKGNILDTLAEILHARGKNAEAIAVYKQAMQEDPGSKHYPAQIEKFQKEMAEKK